MKHILIAVAFVSVLLTAAVALGQTAGDTARGRAERVGFDKAEAVRTQSAGLPLR